MPTPMNRPAKVIHLLARSRKGFLRASQGLSSSLNFLRRQVEGMAFFWRGGKGRATEEFACEGALNGRVLLAVGGDQVLEGREAKWGVRYACRCREAIR
jgi:hypothetical protein